VRPHLIAARAKVLRDPTVSHFSSPAQDSSHTLPSFVLGPASAKDSLQQASRVLRTGLLSCITSELGLGQHLSLSPSGNHGVIAKPPEQGCEPTVQRRAEPPRRLPLESSRVLGLASSLWLPKPLPFGLTKNCGPHLLPVVAWPQKSSCKAQAVPTSCQCTFQQSLHSAVPKNHRTTGSFNLHTWEFQPISGNI
jgi:hypothetical protein